MGSLACTGSAFRGKVHLGSRALREALMLTEVFLSSLFDGEGASPDVDLWHERLDWPTRSTSFSLHFGGRRIFHVKSHLP